MATIQGTGGAVSLITGFNVKAQSWSLDIIVETADTSGFTDNGWRAREGTIVDAQGTVVGHAEGGSSTPVVAGLVAATADPDAAKGSITLTAEAGNLYSFSAILTQTSMTRPVDGKMDLSYNFVMAAGPITQTWA